MMVPTIFVVSKKAFNYLEIGLIVAFWVFRADGKVDHPVHVVGLRDSKEYVPLGQGNETRRFLVDIWNPWGLFP
jgi:hypothetical protein